MTKTIDVIGGRTREIIEALSAMSVGDVITYEEMAGRAKQNAKDASFLSALRNARKTVQRDSNMVIECIRTVGVKRLNDTEILKTGKAGIRKIAGRCRQTIDKISCVNYETLNESQKPVHNASIAVLSVIAQVGSVESYKQIEHRVTIANSRLSIGETLEFLK